MLVSRFLYWYSENHQVLFVCQRPLTKEERMAKIIRRIWASDGALGKRVRHTTLGYTLMVNGKRERKFSSDWEEPDALKALSERQQQIGVGQVDKPIEVRLGQVVERYLRFKADHGKRSL